ncbi:MAG: hypothetical protein R3A80_08480 [Bdellovibrionota bacterium]
MDSGDYEAALNILAGATDSSSRSLRAVIFEKMGYLHASLAELVGSYRQRPNRVIANRAGGLAFLLGETRLIQGLPKDSVGVRLAIAQEELMAGNIQKAKATLPSVQAINSMQASPFKSKAIVLASAIHSATGNVRAALEVLGGDFPQTAGVDLAEIRLQRALVLFEVRKYAEALDELNYITRASPAWYRGQIVGAWAAFHVEDYNLALGQLMNLRSPFLAGKFNPEKHLLQSVVLFQLCHYESAGRAVAKLREDYGNMNDSFSKVSSLTQNPSKFYDQLKDYSLGKVKQESSALDKIWDGILGQPFIADASSSIEKLRFERKNIDERFRSRSMQATRGALLRIFDKLEETYKLKIARYSRSLVGKLKNDVKESLEGALAVELEVNTRVRDRLIKAQLPVQKNIDFKKEVEKGFEFWPFQGEFWRDETGGYAFATTDVCEEGAR